VTRVPKVKEFCHFYIVTAETQSPQRSFIKKFSLCALCVSAVGYNFSTIYNIPSCMISRKGEK
jgi:hypothetical protein